MTGTDGVKSFETLDVQVKALEGDVRDIKTSIAGLGAEVRQALANVTSQFAERNKTPWVAIGGMLTVVLSILYFMADRTIAPMQANIKSMQDEIVPRVEHNYRESAANSRFSKIEEQLFPKDEALFRYSVNDHRLTNLESTVLKIQDRRYDEMVKRNDQLREENRALRGK